MGAAVHADAAASRASIPPFDWLGFALLCAALFGLMTGIADGQREGWGSDTIVLRLVVGAAAAVGFVLWELHTPRALLDIRIFANLEFSAAALIAFIFGAGMMGSTYVMPVFVQTIIGFTPLLAGLMMMPAGIMLAFIFPLAGRLADAMPASTMIIVGLLLFSAGFALMAVADVDTTFWTLVGMVMVSRLGLGFINPSLNASSLKALPADKVRQGAGVANFMRQLGGAFGINLMVAFFEVRTRFHADALTATQDWGNRTTERLLTPGRAAHAAQRPAVPAAEGRRATNISAACCTPRRRCWPSPTPSSWSASWRSLAADPGRHAVALAARGRGGSPSADTQEDDGMASKDTNVVGVWRLVSTKATDPEGRQVGVPFGPRGMGLVTLTSDGRMMAVLVDGRASLPEGTPRQYSSYCGNYTFDGSTLTTIVDANCDPVRFTAPQVRKVRFDGERMILTPPAADVNGVKVTRELTWERISARVALGSLPGARDSVARLVPLR